VKSWQIFLIGAAAVVAALFLPRYEPVIEGAGTVAIVAVVAFGFSLRPRRDVFYVRTTVKFTDLDRNLSVEHDQIAVRVEMARLWLLFLPTLCSFRNEWGTQKVERELAQWGESVGRSPSQ
jgi:hypothetical protein